MRFTLYATIMAPYAYKSVDAYEVFENLIKCNIASYAVLTRFLIA